MKTENIKKSFINNFENKDKSEEISFNILQLLNKKYVGSKSSTKRSSIDMKKVGKLLGRGTEGFVYEYGRGMVLKINLNPYDELSQKEINKVISKIRDNESSNESSPIVKIYDWGYFKEDNIWWICMERLVRLSEREKEAFYLHHLLYNSYVSCKISDIEEMFFKNKEEERMREFVIGMRNFPLRHYDFIDFNVMKDRKSKKWKMIDIEGFCS